MRRWLPEGQRGEIGTKHPAAEVPLMCQALGGGPQMLSDYYS
jgi:hypothetical protein